jgi:flagellar hook-basal body complex protein FliE
MISSVKGLDPRISKNVLKLNNDDDTGPSFGDRLKSMLTDANDKQHLADDAVHKVTTGEMDIQDGMVALSEADISLRYLLQVRSKVLQAYNEIIKMQI